MRLSTDQERFAADLQRGGTGLVEMKRLLEAFAEHGDFHTLKDQARDQNLIGKSSEHMIEALLSAFKRRFLASPSVSHLPPPLVLARSMRSPMPDAAKNQVLFPYFVYSDALVRECYASLVLTKASLPSASLTKWDVQGHLEELRQPHPELSRWSQYLKLRWARGFLALLRHFGLMERHPSTRLRRLWLSAEAFTFFWFWLWGEGSFWETYRNDLWTLLQVDDQDKERLLSEGQLRGWWRYQRAGEIVDFAPKSARLEEWLNHGLV